MISGAAALLASAFPNLTGQQIMADPAEQRRRCRSARAPTPIFGRGILNIAARLPAAGQPQPARRPGGRRRRRRRPGLDGDGRRQDRDGRDDRPRRLFARLCDDPRLARSSAPSRTGRSAGRFSPGLSTATAGARGIAVSITVDRKLTGQPQVGLAQLGLTYEDCAQGAGAFRDRDQPARPAHWRWRSGLSESGKTLERRLTGHYRDAFLVARDPMSRTGFHGDSAGALGRAPAGSAGSG